VGHPAAASRGVRAVDAGRRWCSMNQQLPVQLSFDVSLPERAQRIRELVGTARLCILEIGRELIAAKATVVHGEWLGWLKDEFGWSDETARKYMRVAEAFQIPTKLEFAGLTIDATAFYALSAPDVPPEACAEAVERAEDGEHISKADAETLIAEALLLSRTLYRHPCLAFPADGTACSSGSAAT
jgi:hypothetical protein